MAHPLPYARRLIRQLPADPSSMLLESKSYRDPTFIVLYLEQCDEVVFRDPRKGLRWAKPALELVLSFDEQATPETSAVLKRTLVVRAYATLGSACRATCAFADADAAYQKALAIVRAEEIPSVDEANVNVRLAVLRSCQEKGDEALKLVDKAILVYRKHKHQSLGDALAIRGYILNTTRDYPQAIECLHEALEISEPRKSSPAAQRVYYAASHELAYVVAHTSSIGDLGSAIKAANHARSLIQHLRDSPYKAALDWIVGKAALRLGSTRLAERKYQAARHEFIRLKLPYQLALLGLDISVLYCQEGRWQELEDLAAETYQYFRTLSGNTAALGSLRLWLDAIRAQDLTDKVIEEVQTTLESQVNCRSRG